MQGDKFVEKKKIALTQSELVEHYVIKQYTEVSDFPNCRRAVAECPGRDRTVWVMYGLPLAGAPCYMRCLSN